METRYRRKINGMREQVLRFVDYNIAIKMEIKNENTI